MKIIVDKNIIFTLLTSPNSSKERNNKTTLVAE